MRCLLVPFFYSLQNEAEVGQGIKESGVDRKDIFITSKVNLKQYIILSIIILTTYVLGLTKSTSSGVVDTEMLKLPRMKL